MSFAQEGVPPAGGGSALTQQSSAATSIQARWRQTRTAEPPRTPASQGEWGECTIYAFTAVLQAQLEIKYNTALDEDWCRSNHHKRLPLFATPG